MRQVWSRLVSVLIQGGLWGWEALRKLSSETHNSKAKVIWKSFELDINASQACFNYSWILSRVLKNILNPEKNKLKGSTKVSKIQFSTYKTSMVADPYIVLLTLNCLELFSLFVSILQWLGETRKLSINFCTFRKFKILIDSYYILGFQNGQQQHLRSVSIFM